MQVLFVVLILIYIYILLYISDHCHMGPNAEAASEGQEVLRFTPDLVTISPEITEKLIFRV